MNNTIGVMGDSHDNLGLIRKAVSLFNETNVLHVLHTGDVVSPFAAKELQKLSCPFTVTLGNNDGDKLKLKEVISSSGGKLLWPSAVLQLVDKRVVLIHGEDPELAMALAKSGDFSLVAYGHWHEALVKRVADSCLLVNPGETCGYLTGKPTVALVNLDALEASLVDL